MTLYDQPYIFGAIAVLVLAGILWMFRHSRARALRRFNAVVNLYAEREIDRERQWNAQLRIRRFTTNQLPHR